MKELSINLINEKDKFCPICKEKISQVTVIRWICYACKLIFRIQVISAEK